MFPVYQSQLSKVTIVAFVILSSTACSRLQIGGFGEPEVAEGTVPVVDTQVNGSVYTVQTGDNLYLIGKRFGVRYQDLAAWNNIRPPYLIQPGQRLALAPNAAVPNVPNVPVVSNEPQVLVFDWDTGTARPETPAPQVTPQPAPIVTADTPVLEFDWQTGQPRAVTSPAGNADQALYYTVKSGDSLSLIAKQYGVTYTDLAAWNSIPPPYSLKVGQTLLVSANTSSSSLSAMNTMGSMNALPPANIGTMRYHRVQRGETLYSIARSYGRTYQEVATWNSIPAPYSLRVGQNLQVSPSSRSNSFSIASATSTAPLDGQYKVARGDTLSSIANRFNRSVKELATWNGLKKPYPLNVGQKLIVSSHMSLASSNVVSNQPNIIEPKRMTISVPKPAAEVEQNVMLASAATDSRVRKTLRGEIVYHAVQKGETLASIAESYRQNTHELALWNGIAPPYPIYPGQTIMIYR